MSEELHKVTDGRTDTKTDTQTELLPELLVGAKNDEEAVLEEEKMEEAEEGYEDEEADFL